MSLSALPTFYASLLLSLQLVWAQTQSTQKCPVAACTPLSERGGCEGLAGRQDLVVNCEKNCALALPNTPWAEGGYVGAWLEGKDQHEGKTY